MVRDVYGRLIQAGARHGCIIISDGLRAIFNSSRSWARRDQDKRWRPCRTVEIPSAHLGVELQELARMKALATNEADDILNR